MKSKKLVFTGIALMAFVGIAGVIYALPFGAVADRGGSIGDLDRRSTTIQSTKILQFSATGTENIFSLGITEADELLIKTVTISNDSSATSTSRGTWGLLLDVTSPPPPTPFLINTTGFETQHYNYDPPILLEAGNTLVFQRFDGASDSFTSTITFYGTEPSGSGVIMR